MRDDQVDKIIAKLEEIRCQEIDVEEAIKLLGLHIIERLTAPAPAPDLDALIEKYIHTIKANYYISAWTGENAREKIDDILRAFAAELGVKP